MVIYNLIDDFFQNKKKSKNCVKIFNLVIDFLHYAYFAIHNKKYQLSLQYQIFKSMHQTTIRNLKICLYKYLDVMNLIR